MKEIITTVRQGDPVGEDLSDWGRVDSMTEEELIEAIKNDPDTFEATPEMLKNAMLLRPNKPKERLTVRFDADMVEWFRAQGPGYQTRMNAVLRTYYESVTAGHSHYGFADQKQSPVEDSD